MPRYINDHCSFLRGEDGEFAAFGQVVVLSEAKVKEIRAYSSGVLPLAESAHVPAPKPAPPPAVEPAPAPAAAPAVEREPLGGLHHAKLAKLAKALGYTGDDVGKDASLAFLNEKCEPAEVAATREGLGY